MGAEEMEAGIVGEATKQAEEIGKDAQSKRDEILSIAHVDVEKEKEKIQCEFNESATRLEAKELASARILAKKDIANEKKEAVERVYRSFFSRLEKEIGREEFLRLLYDAGKTQLKKVEQVRVAKEDVPIARSLGVAISPVAIDGGIILEGGGEAVDLSVGTIKETLMHKTLREVSQKLFGD